MSVTLEIYKEDQLHHFLCSKILVDVDIFFAIIAKKTYAIRIHG